MSKCRGAGAAPFARCPVHGSAHYLCRSEPPDLTDEDWDELDAAIRARLPRGVGTPSISEAPEVRIAVSRTTGLVSVWVSGVGYLGKDERQVLAALISSNVLTPEGDDAH